MMLTKKILLEAINQVLDEEIYGSMATIYHGSPLPPRKFLKILKKKQITSQRGFYGNGLYAVWDLKDTFTSEGEYGKYIYKLNAKLYGFLVFDEEMCKKIYKKSLSIIEQIRLMPNGNQIIRKMKELEQKDRGDFFTMEEFSHPLSAYHKDAPDEEDENTLMQGPSARFFNKFFNREIPGLVFHGKDGPTVLVHNTDSLVPVSWSYSEGKDITQINWKNILDPSKWGEVVVNVDKQEFGTDEDRKEFIKKRSKAGFFPKSEFGDNFEDSYKKYLKDKELDK